MTEVLTLCVGKNKYEVQRSKAIKNSQYISRIILNNNMTNEIKINLKDNYNHFNIISEILNENHVDFSKSSISFVSAAAKMLEMKETVEKTENFQNYLIDSERIFNEKKLFIKAIEIEKLIFKICKDNMEQLLKLLDSEILKYINVSQMLVKACLIKQNNIELYVELLKELKNNDNRFLNNVFTLFIEKIKRCYQQRCYQFEINYLLQKLHEASLIDVIELMNNTYKNFYFAHLLPLDNFYELQYENRHNIINNIDEDFKKDNWMLHKKFVKEGINPRYIASVIKNDDIEKLQELSAQDDFDFNAKFEFSLYERNSLLNSNPSLIEYSAFYGAINCFKYLLINNAKITNNIIEFVIAGENLEIFHICEQNDIDFSKGLEKAIKYHSYAIFNYLIENYPELLNKRINYEQQCIEYVNMVSLTELIKEGIEPNHFNSLINFSAKQGNYNFLDFLFTIQKYKSYHLLCTDIEPLNTNNTFQLSCENGDKECFKLLLQNLSININNVLLVNFHQFYALHVNMNIMKLLK